MTTFLVLVIVGILWLVANSNYERTNEWRYRRKRSAYAWAGGGAILGSFFGVAGIGSAIAGTLPGAVVGYLIASNLMKSDVDPRVQGSFDEPEVEYTNTKGKDPRHGLSEPLRLAESMVIVDCPKCSQRLRVPEGKKLRIKCNKCEGVFEYGDSVE